MGTRTSADIDIGSRVITTQPLPEGVAAGSRGLVVGPPGWIQRRWRVEFGDGRSVAVPEYALDPEAASGRFARG